MLYLTAAGLAGCAFFVLGPVSTWLAAARWVDGTPRAAVALWQALGASAMVSGIGAGLCVAVERYHRGFGGGVRDLFIGATTGHPLTGLGLPDALGLTLAVDLGIVLTCLFATVVCRTLAARVRHRRLVDLLSKRIHATGAAVLEHPAAVAYCVPGLRPRIVVSTGALSLLEDTEVSAVIAHERGHAIERHGLVMLPLVGLAAIFTFIPYARLAPTAVAGLLEMTADDYAVRRCERSALASALVSMATAGAAPCCAFGMNGGGVRRRVDRLVQRDRPPARTAMALGLACAVLSLPVTLLVMS